MAIDLSRVFPVIESWGEAHTLTSAKMQEDAARQGHNRMITFTSHFTQTQQVFELLEELAEVSGRSFASLKLRTVLYLTAPVVQAIDYAASRWTEKNSRITIVFKQVIGVVYNHVGSLCQIVSVIANIALFRLGQRATATTALIILSMGYLERHHYLPLKISRIYLTVFPWVGEVSALLTGDWWAKALAAGELWGKLHHLLSLKKMVPYDQVEHASHLTYEQFNRILEGKAKLEVNRAHVYIAPFPHVKELNFTPLKTLFEQVKWDDQGFLSQIEAGLKKDARWENSSECQHILNDPSKNQALKIEYIKRNFNLLIYNIENECIATGEPLDYGMLKNYLAFIAEKLPHAPQDYQIQTMIQLAVEGGDYCGPGVYYQLETIATALLLNNFGPVGETDVKERARLPLRQRLLLILQQERLNIAVAFHLLIGKITPHNWISGGDADPHAVNHTNNTLAFDFGLPDQGAAYDRTANIEFFEFYIARFLFHITPEKLWTGYDVRNTYLYHYLVRLILRWDETKFKNNVIQGYTKERITDALQSRIGTPAIPTSDVMKWAREWIENLPIDFSEKETFEKKLTHAEFQNFNESFQNPFIQAMLVDMGILRIV
jgi:hypothetical protein